LTALAAILISFLFMGDDCENAFVEGIRFGAVAMEEDLPRLPVSTQAEQSGGR